MPRKKQNHTLAVDSNYARFLESMVPFGIAVVESKFRLDRDKYFETESKRLSAAWKCTPVEVGDEYFEADAELSVKLTAPKQKKPLVEIMATFRMHIHAAKPINQEYVNRFTNSEVRILVWPYFREYVTGVCGRMHIPPIVLPVSIKD